MTPNERVRHYHDRAAESQFNHDEMREIYADWAEDLKDFTERELFAQEYHLHRLGRMAVSMTESIKDEEARRAE